MFDVSYFLKNGLRSENSVAFPALVKAISECILY